MRIKATIIYDGGKFKGFQKQTSTNNTITTSLEKALKSLGISDNIRGSGRTDAGVHATGQVIDFEVPSYWTDLNKLQLSLNRKLEYISIKRLQWIEDDFHSRFSAKKRLYRYVFKTSTPSIFEKPYVSYYPTFDEQALQKALKVFEGKHDFSNFIKTGSVTHTNVREVYKARYKKLKNYHIIYFEANGFLRSQVRMMVEASMQVALNQWSSNALNKQLNLEEKTLTKLAPAEGLYLAKIIY
ncbi:MAG: tRNA pseudouridine synthase A (EC [uncultured Sulfurovum sp.]|uniref:tRNA pseudouridine synthase A n=1 Tax=uncultured Sulfurovum sp. TaxID=269237 RepID=A0A6S6SDR0_9BACT|nr:MAG: tRNA pseudouridine synthase A (EC [uncultured Sulfurovum sp.]